MKELTRVEGQIMQILWAIKKGFVKDIMDHFPEPKPAYNTISTIIRILEKKKFVSHHAYGKSHEYHPLVSKNNYTNTLMKTVIKNYFNGSFQELVSFFAKDRKLDINELEDITTIIKGEIKKQKAKES